ncbi:hypothetical protein [Blautia sp. MSJ-36]|uniref:hypothetical protein n=1 Tax=Blautia sp. MSJ-36 TaxID=2841530 RepID=UPI001C0F584A|nr:hypothetical protein [Blautia sp. MSJ-36]MBU5446324.1 hypothetical protein [Blautia sp. MSJ-36]
MNIEMGQAITYKNERRGIGYGVIIHSTENSISFVEIDRITEFTKCYDELGARYPEDKDNVRLKDCPPPFKQLSRGVDGGVYALADINNPIVFTKEQCIKYHVTVLDKGEKISDRDMNEIFNHPWDEQKQKQIELRRSQAVDKFGGIVNDTPDDSYSYKF